MVDSICGQGFAYAREVEEDRQKSSQTRAKGYEREAPTAEQNSVNPV
jgi:hypothetical protein